MYRLWYETLGSEYHSDIMAQKFCYAESTDGMTWKKPVLGLVGYFGNT